MLHANVRFAGKCSVSLKLATVVLILFGAIYLIKIAIKLQSSVHPTISISWLTDVPHQSTSCNPKSNIFFLKTHKCASSTLQNIFLRYGTVNNLNFVLPSLGNYLGNQAKFHHSMAYTAPWHRLGYNIFCHHTVFNKAEIQKIMPRDTIYITIVRHPISLFESLYEYADLALKYHQTFEEFVYERLPGSGISTDRAQGYLGVNQMAYDMGVHPTLFENSSAIDKAINRLDSSFDLVLLAEHFDQSMVLLADKLCWDLDEVTYFKHNSRKIKAFNINKTTADKIENLNSADMRIYRFFEQKFRKQIENYGGWTKLESQVQKLRKKNQKWETFCARSSRSTVGKKFDLVFQPDKVEQLFLKNENKTCQMMGKHEIAFTKQLKMNQMIKVSKMFKMARMNANGAGRETVPNMWGQLGGELGFRALNSINNPFTK